MLSGGRWRCSIASCAVHPGLAHWASTMQTAVIAVILGLLGAAVAQAEECRPETIGSFPATAVIEGRTFKLDDGRAVRLAAIEVPPGDAAKAALQRLVAGSRVTLKRQGPASDRYGHLVAFAFIEREGSERWVEREMVASGHARAGARIADAACAAALLAAERAARRAKQGLWADAKYAIRRADDAAGLLAERGRFTLAEGRVLSVREAGGTIYVNFGRVWSQNLTVTILKRNERLLHAAGIEPKRLEGRRLRVRGWIEDRNGPQIEVARAEQIEFADRD